MKKRNAVYPSKTSMNLCFKEESRFPLKKLLPLLLVILILAAAFGKFAVADRYAAMNAAEAQVSALSAQKEALTASISGYDKVLEEYNRYSTNWMSDEELLAVLRTDVLDLVEKEFMGECEVRSISVVGNILSVELGGVDLDGVAGLVQTLYERSDVQNVTVYTASSDAESRNSVVSMVITLIKTFDGGDVG